MNDRKLGDLSWGGCKRQGSFIVHAVRKLSRYIDQIILTTSLNCFGAIPNNHKI